jgi:UPF0755 protein
MGEQGNQPGHQSTEQPLDQHPIDPSNLNPSNSNPSGPDLSHHDADDYQWEFRNRHQRQSSPKLPKIPAFPKSRLVYLLSAIPILLGVGALGSGLWWQGASSPMQAASQTNPTGQTIQVEIPPGTPSEVIGEKLLQAKLIRSMPAWKLWLRWKGMQDGKGGLQAGTFALSPQQSLDAIGTKIWNGEVVTAQFTIPEGWSIKQMAEYFQANRFFSAQAFLDTARKIPRDKYPWLPVDITSLEGFLYPNTYTIPAGQITPEQAIDMMLQQFGQVALPLYEQQRQASPVAQKLSLLEWVTLSSIVEKESVIAQERPMIAGVFWNRLKQNIPLGSDPTVEYGLGIRQTADQPLTYAQVETPHPYNTYINAGLPPGPIANPATASLKATLQPAQTDYLYFVARYDGTHVFSRTLAEHESAQNRIHDQREQQSPPPTQLTPQSTVSPTTQPPTQP